MLTQVEQQSEDLQNKLRYVRCDQRQQQVDFIWETRVEDQVRLRENQLSYARPEPSNRLENRMRIGPMRVYRYEHQLRTQMAELQWNNDLSQGWDLPMLYVRARPKTLGPEVAFDRDLAPIRIGGTDEEGITRFSLALAKCCEEEACKRALNRKYRERPEPDRIPAMVLPAPLVEAKPGLE